MLSSLLLSQLNAVLCQVFETISRQQVEASLLGGKLVLKKLRLKESILASYSLPICVTYGVLKELRVQVNWFRLLSHPVVVEADGLLVVATTIPTNEWDVAVERDNLAEQKKLRLATDELLTYAKVDRSIATRFFYKLAYTLIGRIECNENWEPYRGQGGLDSSLAPLRGEQGLYDETSADEETTRQTDYCFFPPAAQADHHQHRCRYGDSCDVQSRRRAGKSSNFRPSFAPGFPNWSLWSWTKRLIAASISSLSGGSAWTEESSSSAGFATLSQTDEILFRKIVVAGSAIYIDSLTPAGPCSPWLPQPASARKALLVRVTKMREQTRSSQRWSSDLSDPHGLSQHAVRPTGPPSNENPEKPDILYGGAEQLSPASNNLHNDDLRGLSSTPPSVSICATDATDSVEQGNPGGSFLPPKPCKHNQPHQEDCRVSPPREGAPRRREKSSKKGEQRAEKGSGSSQRRPFESRQYRWGVETRDGKRKAGEHPVADTEARTGSRTDERMDRPRQRVARRREKLTGFESADFASNGDASERIRARHVVDSHAGALQLDGGCQANGLVDSVRDPQERRPVSVCNGDPRGTTPLLRSKTTHDETGTRRCEDDTDMDNSGEGPLMTVYDLFTHEEMTLRAEASAPQHQYLYRPGRLELRVRMLSRPAQAVPGSFAFSDRIFYRPLRAITDLACFSKVFRGSRGRASASRKEPPAEEQRHYFLAWRRRLLAKTSAYLGRHESYSQLKSFLRDTLRGKQATKSNVGNLSSLLDETDEVTTEPLSFPLNALAPRLFVPGVNSFGQHSSPSLQSASGADERQNDNRKAGGTAEDDEGRVASHVELPILAEEMPTDRQAEPPRDAGVPGAVAEAPEEMPRLVPPFMERNIESKQGHNDTESRGGDVERVYRSKRRHDLDDQCIAAFEETYWVDDILRIRAEALESLKGLMHGGDESQDQVREPENAAPAGRTKKKKKRGDHSRLRAGQSFWDQDRNKRGKQNKSLLEKSGQMSIRTVGSNVRETPFRREEDGHETPSDLFFYPAQESPSLCENSRNPTTFATLDSPAESWTIWGNEEKNSSLEKSSGNVPDTGPVCEDDSAPVRFTSSSYTDETCRGAEASPPQRTPADDTDEVNKKTGNTKENIIGLPPGDRPPSCVSSIFRDRLKEASTSPPLDAPLSWQVGTRDSAATVNGQDEEEASDFLTGDEYSGQEEEDTEEEEAAVRLRLPPSCSRARLRKKGRNLFDEGRSSTCVAFQDVSIEDFLSPDLAHRTVLRTLAPPEPGCPFLACPSSLGSASLSSPLASLPSPCYASSALPCIGPLPGVSGQRSVCSHGGSSSSSAPVQSSFVADPTDAEQAAERACPSCDPRISSSTCSRGSTGFQHKASSYASPGLTRPDPTSPSVSAQCVGRGAERDRGHSSGEEPLPSFTAVSAWTPHPYSADPLCSGAAASRRLSSPASPPSSPLGSFLPSPPFRPPRLEARPAASGLFSSFFVSATAEPGGPAVFPPSQGSTQGGWLRWDLWAKRQKSTPDSLLYVHLKDSVLVTLSPAAALRMVHVLLKALEPLERSYLLARMEATAREAVTRQETYLAEMALGNSSHSCSDLCVVLEAPCRLLLPFHEHVDASEGLLFSCGAVCVDSHLQLPRVDANELSVSSFSPFHSSSGSFSTLGAPLSMRATGVLGNSSGWDSVHANSTPTRETPNLPVPSGEERRDEHERLRISEKLDEGNSSGARQRGKSIQTVPAVSPFPSLLLCSERLFDRYAFGCGDCTVLRVGNASAFDYFLSFACTCSSCASPSERVYRGNEGNQREENKGAASRDKRRQTGERRIHGSRVSPSNSVHAGRFPTHGRNTLTDAYSSSEQVLVSSVSALRTRKGERDTPSALVSSPPLRFESTDAGNVETKKNVKCSSPSSLRGFSLPPHEDSSSQGWPARLPSDTVNVLDEVPEHEISLSCTRLRERSTNTPGCRSGPEASEMWERRRTEGAEEREGVINEEKPSEKRKGKRDRYNAENPGDKDRDASTESLPYRRRISASTGKRSSQRGDHAPLYLLYPTSFRLFVDVCHLTRAQGLPAFRLMLRDDNLIGGIFFDLSEDDLRKLVYPLASLLETVSSIPPLAASPASPAPPAASCAPSVPGKETLVAPQASGSVGLRGEELPSLSHTGEQPGLDSISHLFPTTEKRHKSEGREGRGSGRPLSPSLHSAEQEIEQMETGGEEREEGNAVETTAGQEGEGTREQGREHAWRRGLRPHLLFTNSSLTVPSVWDEGEWEDAAKEANEEITGDGQEGSSSRSSSDRICASAHRSVSSVPSLPRVTPSSRAELKPLLVSSSFPSSSSSLSLAPGALRRPVPSGVSTETRWVHGWGLWNGFHRTSWHLHRALARQREDSRRMRNACKRRSRSLQEAADVEKEGESLNGVWTREAEPQGDRDKQSSGRGERKHGEGEQRNLQRCKEDTARRKHLEWTASVDPNDTLSSTSRGHFFRALKTRQLRPLLKRKLESCRKGRTIETESGTNSKVDKCEETFDTRGKARKQFSASFHPNGIFQRDRRRSSRRARAPASVSTYSFPSANAVVHVRHRAKRRELGYSDRGERRIRTRGKRYRRPADSRVRAPSGYSEGRQAVPFDSDRRRIWIRAEEATKKEDPSTGLVNMELRIQISSLCVRLWSCLPFGGRQEEAQRGTEADASSLSLASTLRRGEDDERAADVSRCRETERLGERQLRDSQGGDTSEDGGPRKWRGDKNGQRKSETRSQCSRPLRLSQQGGSLSGREAGEALRKGRVSMVSEGSLEESVGGETLTCAVPEYSNVSSIGSTRRRKSSWNSVAFASPLSDAPATPRSSKQTFLTPSLSQSSSPLSASLESPLASSRPSFPGWEGCPNFVVLPEASSAWSLRACLLTHEFALTIKTVETSNTRCSLAVGSKSFSILLPRAYRSLSRPNTSLSSSPLTRRRSPTSPGHRESLPTASCSSSLFLVPSSLRRPSEKWRRSSACDQEESEYRGRNRKTSSSRFFSNAGREAVLLRGERSRSRDTDFAVYTSALSESDVPQPGRDRSGGSKGSDDEEAQRRSVAFEHRSERQHAVGVDARTDGKQTGKRREQENQNALQRKQRGESEVTSEQGTSVRQGEGAEGTRGPSGARKPSGGRKPSEMASQGRGVFSERYDKRETRKRSKEGVSQSPATPSSTGFPARSSQQGSLARDSSPKTSPRRSKVSSDSQRLPRRSLADQRRRRRDSGAGHARSSSRTSPSLTPLEAVYFLSPIGEENIHPCPSLFLIPPLTRLLLRAPCTQRSDGLFSLSPCGHVQTCHNRMRINTQRRNITSSPLAFSPSPFSSFSVSSASAALPPSAAEAVLLLSSPLTETRARWVFPPPRPRAASGKREEKNGDKIYQHTLSSFCRRQDYISAERAGGTDESDRKPGAQDAREIEAGDFGFETEATEKYLHHGAKRGRGGGDDEDRKKPLKGHELCEALGDRVTGISNTEAWGKRPHSCVKHFQSHRYPPPLETGPETETPAHIPRELVVTNRSLGFVSLLRQSFSSRSEAIKATGETLTETETVRVAGENTSTKERERRGQKEEVSQGATENKRRRMEDTGVQATDKEADKDAHEEKPEGNVGEQKSENPTRGLLEQERENAWDIKADLCFLDFSQKLTANLVKYRLALDWEATAQLVGRRGRIEQNPGKGNVLSQASLSLMLAQSAAHGSQMPIDKSRRVWHIGQYQFVYLRESMKAKNSSRLSPL
ncbi:UNVERIFIED_CONTAM: hypothetical protein HHA_216290 [Hammondia hammondi]|eukprot:XP_008886373.1 hypothetical protein HHA_216290 [Hammondia hammondi]